MRFVYLFRHRRQRCPTLNFSVMTATLTTFAPELSKADQKARRKADKKRFNKHLETLGH